jgi:hypothetical protein
VLDRRKRNGFAGTTSTTLRSESVDCVDERAGSGGKFLGAAPTTLERLDSTIWSGIVGVVTKTKASPRKFVLILASFVGAVQVFHWTTIT